MIAILFISIHLLNIIGARLIIGYFIHQNDAITIHQIDMGNYDEEQLLEIKVPLRLPYYSSSLKYERYYGEIDLNGKYYNYVMRKVINDTVYLLCLSDQIKSALHQKKGFCTNMSAGVEGLSQEKNNIALNLKKNHFTTDYIQLSAHDNLMPLMSFSLISEDTNASALADCFSEKPDRPPCTGGVCC